MGGDDSKTREGDGVGLFIYMVFSAIDFVSTEIGLWDCRRRGCGKKTKALLRRRRRNYMERLKKLFGSGGRNE
jgi:hypothetical protein